MAARSGKAGLRHRRSAHQPTGHAALDAALPTGGWPEAALTEILLAGQGVGELQLVWPALARLSAAGERIVLVAPPYVPYPQAWQNAGIDLRQLSIIQASEARCAVGGGTMPALGQLRRGAVLAAQG